MWRERKREGERFPALGVAACDLKKKNSFSAHSFIPALCVSLCRFQQKKKERKSGRVGVKENRGKEEAARDGSA